MGTNILGEHPVNAPIEEDEEDPTQKAIKGNSRENKWLESLLKG